MYPIIMLLLGLRFVCLHEYFLIDSYLQLYIQVDIIEAGLVYRRRSSLLFVNILWYFIGLPGKIVEC